MSTEKSVSGLVTPEENLITQLAGYVRGGRPMQMTTLVGVLQLLERQTAEIISLNQQLSAKTISEQNIINAFGIKGEGAHSKLVIEYAHGLVAENHALKPTEIPCGAIENGRAFIERLEAYPFESQGGDLKMCSDWQSLVQCFDYLAEFARGNDIQTPATDAAIAEIKAQGVDEFLNDEFVQEVAMRLADFNGETEESVSTVVWSGMPPEPEGNVWELEYVSRASFLSRKLKEFAANLRAGRKG